MYKNKRVLLIAGGGTLGTYTAAELLRLGAWVDIICPEEKQSDNERLRFIQSYAGEELLKDLFAANHYDGIVNFIHYEDVEEFKSVYSFLIQNTDHLIFLSSYRVYADKQHPITETAPRLHEAIDDKEFIQSDTYGVRKALCEDFLTGEHMGENWTIVRPVISFSQRRLDIIMNSGRCVLERVEENKTLLLPKSARELRAGLDWAGNSGRLIANLLFKREAIGEAFTIYSGHNMTWGEVADAYAAETGVVVEWVSDEAYIDTIPAIRNKGKEHWWMWNYDRKCNRDIDCSKVLSVTGLERKNFLSVQEGIRTELDILGWKKEKN